jgi:hypothetical protein
LVSVAVAVSLRDAATATISSGSRAIAYAALVEGSDTVVNIVADAVCIGVSRAASAANSEGVILISVTVAVPLWDVATTANSSGSWAIAYAALVEVSDTAVNIVTDAVFIGVSSARSSALVEGV